MLITIRPEKPSDTQAIELLTIDAFRQAPYSDHTEQFIIRELRSANALTLSLVAEASYGVVGHVAVSPVHIGDGTGRWFGLGPISVSPTHQGKGIGSQLVRAALEQLQAHSANGGVLLGDPNFYHRFGFKPVPGLVLPGVPPAHFQAVTFGPATPQGIVTYHEAFNAKR